MPVRRPLTARALSALLLLVAIAYVALAAGSPAPVRGQTEQQASSRAQQLKAEVAAETRKIGRTQAGINSAQSRLDAINTVLDREQTRLKDTTQRIVAARTRIERLENRMHRATVLLQRNLVARYENGPPDLVSVIVHARSFSDLLDSANFQRRIADQNARMLEDARTSRQEVAAEADRLVVLQRRTERVARVIERQSAKASAIRDALLHVQERQVAKRARTAASLADLRATIARLQRERARAARVNPAITAQTFGTTTTPNGAPAAVAKVIAAGNAIAGLPYVWGGGHGSFQAAGYDCSGSVSYALAAAGLLSSPLDSTGFESWGEPGPGRWITVYANAGHAYMYVAGRRFDTSALRGGGTRWTTEPRSNAGFVARHPPGL